MNASNKRTALILGGGIATMVLAACLILLLAALLFNTPLRAGRGFNRDPRYAPAPALPVPTPGAPDGRFQDDPRNDNYRGWRERRYDRRFDRNRRGFGPFRVIGALVRCVLALGVLGGLIALVVWVARRNRPNASPAASTIAAAEAAPIAPPSPTPPEASIDSDSSGAKPPDDPAASI
jgi:hypothetical protein